MFPLERSATLVRFCSWRRPLGGILKAPWTRPIQ